MKIFINHVGYNSGDFKQCIVRAPKSAALNSFKVIDFNSGKEVYNGELIYKGPVAKWEDWEFWTGDFSKVNNEGTYVISCGEGLPSAPFEIGNKLLQNRLLKNVLFYFKTQRASGIWNKQDYEIPFYGERKDKVDVHGGYYDASGDFSKYMTHLSYANYMNPQQIPMTVYAMTTATESLVPQIKNIGERKVFQTMTEEETAHGADFLVRMLDPEGFFYMTVFDNWSKDVKRRTICSYKGMRGEKFDSYKCGYRQGAGVAIAALARAARIGVSGNFTANDYMYGAVKAFKHLEKHNLEYLDDGKENIIDDYCALMAATELAFATGCNEYLDAARRRVENIKGRLCSDEKYKGWFRSDDTGERPYFHAAEAGLPLISLNHYLVLEKDVKRKKEIANVVYNSIKFELDITNEVNNPFGYPRQYVKSLNGKKRGAFFIPHENETNYWWQGENARIASLSTAAKKTIDIGLRVCKELGVGTEKEIDEIAQQLNKYRVNQLNWILGLNPFDICFLKGAGRGASDYHWSAPGGISNGITAEIGNEESIAYMMEEYQNDGSVNWRWCEQWLPHSTWFLLALIQQYKDS